MTVKIITAPSVALEAHRCDTGVTYRVTFQGPQAEARAVAYMDARGRTHAFREAEGTNLEAFPVLADALYPLCHHGMDARLCMDPDGPHHFGTAAQDRY